MLVRMLPIRQLYWRRFAKIWLYDCDTKWKHLREQSGDKSAIVIVVDFETLVSRTYQRSCIEKENRNAYPNRFWRDVYYKVDLADVYTRWLVELRTFNIDYTLIDGRQEEYRVLDQNLNIKNFVYGE